MSELQHKIETIRKAMLMVGISPSGIHWQSFAVLHEAAPDKRSKLIAELFNAGSGWFRKGISERYPTYKTSLYLSPKGMPFFVGYGGHAGLYHDIMGVGQEELNLAGWVHISGGSAYIRTSLTYQQDRWFDSEGAHLGVRKSAGHGDIRTHPKPFADADKFDVMPMRELDWDRLERRIAQAMNPDLGVPRLSDMPAIQPCQSFMASDCI